MKIYRFFNPANSLEALKTSVKYDMLQKYFYRFTYPAFSFNRKALQEGIKQMSKSENILAFEAAMRENEELLQKFVAAQKRIVENKEAANDGELMVKAAAEVGFTLTIEELERFMAQSQEVDEEELATISGGSETEQRDGECWKDYYCHWILKFTNDDETYHACFHDYQCILIYHGLDIKFPPSFF